MILLRPLTSNQLLPLSKTRMHLVFLVSNNLLHRNLPPVPLVATPFRHQTGNAMHSRTLLVLVHTYTPT
jgi:hypothetical protein